MYEIQIKNVCQLVGNKILSLRPSECNLIIMQIIFLVYVTVSKTCNVPDNYHRMVASSIFSLL